MCQNRKIFTRQEVSYYRTRISYIICLLLAYLVFSLSPAFLCLLLLCLAKCTPPAWGILKKSMLISSFYDKQYDTVNLRSYSSKEVQWNSRYNSPLYRRENLVVNRLIIVVVYNVSARSSCNTLYPMFS